MRQAVTSNDIIELVRDAGLRPTRQRQSLARQLFSGGDRHVTAEQLHSESLSQGVSVSLATVYNTLHQFTAAGLLRELVVDAGRSYFDTNITAHHHLYFEDSGKLRDVSGDNVTIGELPALPEGAEISRIDIIIRVKNSAPTA
ncbi:MAG: Fur family transcriptional regulator [Proteobacteria bacterium]|nr:Fur family transcriptional regulator [Pseudomonadota bacterium]MDA1355668.1 Fur family transcriptional regulator [Pseudomonadota bacterium]